MAVPRHILILRASGECFEWAEQLHQLTLIPASTKRIYDELDAAGYASRIGMDQVGLLTALGGFYSSTRSPEADWVEVTLQPCGHRDGKCDLWGVHPRPPRI